MFRIAGRLLLTVACLGPLASLPANELASVDAWVGGATAPDGTPLQSDLPAKWHMHNTGGMGRGGPGTGAGLCVFTSINHAAWHQNVEALQGFQKWMTTKPGGGYPEKVDQMIAQMCKEKGFTKPAYLQVEGSDLEILKQACRSGRMPGVTYGYSPSGRYSGKRISHMVSLVHADDKWFVVLDNNYEGNTRYEWLSPEEFRGAYTDTSGQGWAVILLDAGPPPPPWN